MSALRALAIAALLSILLGSNLSAQDNSPVNPPVNPAVGPPFLLMLVHQEVLYGKGPARQKLEASVARICNRLEIPDFWIDLQSLTGPRQVLFFDPFETFEEMERAANDWSKIYAAHPELAKMQEDIDADLKTEDTTIAVRRDDLGYLLDHIDFSAMRFMRVVEIHLLPGHEGDFVEASRILGDAYEKLGEETPWVVYQVKDGMESSVFIVIMPMPALSENDDILSWNEDLRKAEGEEGERLLEKIARESYVSTKSNLYAVSGEMSHVSREFAAGDPDFWTPKPGAPAKRPDSGGITAPGPGQGGAKTPSPKTKEKPQNQ